MPQDESLLEIGETYKLPVETNGKLVFFDYILEKFDKSGENAFLRDVEGESGLFALSAERLEDLVFPLLTDEIEKI